MEAERKVLKQREVVPVSVEQSIEFLVEDMLAEMPHSVAFNTYELKVSTNDERTDRPPGQRGWKALLNVEIDAGYFQLWVFEHTDDMLYRTTVNPKAGVPRQIAIAQTLKFVSELSGKLLELRDNMKTRQRLSGKIFPWYTGRADLSYLEEQNGKRVS